VQWSHWHYVLLEKPALGGRTLAGRVVRPFAALARAWRGQWRRSCGFRQSNTMFESNTMFDVTDVSMEVRMELQQETEVAMAKAIMQQMSQQTARALKESMRQELLEELRDEALELAKVELEDEFSRRRERLLDDLARQRHALEDEMLGELDRQRSQIRQEVKDELAETLLTAQDERQEARAERDRAEGLLVQLMRQLLPGEKPVYLYSCGVRELDRLALNETLSRHRLRVRSKASYSERLVKVRIDQARYMGHTQFWLEALPGEGVEVDADDGDQAETHTR
jgi:hypothetical protein